MLKLLLKPLALFDLSLVLSQILFLIFSLLSCKSLLPLFVSLKLDHMFLFELLLPCCLSFGIGLLLVSLLLLILGHVNVLELSSLLLILENGLPPCLVLLLELFSFHLPLFDLPFSHEAINELIELLLLLDLVGSKCFLILLDYYLGIWCYFYFFNHSCAQIVISLFDQGKLLRQLVFLCLRHVFIDVTIWMVFESHLTELRLYMVLRSILVAV